MRILGLDVGKKRIGVSVSDPLGISAQAVMTIERVSFEKDKKVLQEIVQQYKVEKIIVGMPFNMNGSRGPAAQAMEMFINRLSNALNISVEAHDERLTTISSARILDEAGMERKQQKKHIDQVAAILILQGYLDSRSAIEQ